MDSMTPLDTSLPAAACESPVSSQFAALPLATRLAMQRTSTVWLKMEVAKQLLIDAQSLNGVSIPGVDILDVHPRSILENPTSGQIYFVSCREFRGLNKKHEGVKQTVHWNANDFHSTEIEGMTVEYVTAHGHLDKKRKDRCALMRLYFFPARSSAKKHRAEEDALYLVQIFEETERPRREGTPMSPLTPSPVPSPSTRAARAARASPIPQDPRLSMENLVPPETVGPIKKRGPGRPPKKRDSPGTTPAKLVAQPSPTKLTQQIESHVLVAPHPHRIKEDEVLQAYTYAESSWPVASHQFHPHSFAPVGKFTPPAPAAHDLLPSFIGREWDEAMAEVDDELSRETVSLADIFQLHN